MIRQNAGLVQIWIMKMCIKSNTGLLPVPNYSGIYLSCLTVNIKKCFLLRSCNSCINVSFSLQNSILSALPYLTLWILSFVFSFTSDTIINKNIVTIGGARKIFNSIGNKSFKVLSVLD